MACGYIWNQDSEFTKWQHPAMWYVALGWHAVEFARWQHPAMWQMALGWRHGIRPKVHHIGILHLVSISTVSPQSTCHSAPVCEILSKSDHPLQKQMTSCRFSRWRMSAILDFRGPIMGSLKSPCTTSYRLSIETTANKLLSFWESCVFAISRFSTSKPLYLANDMR